MGWKLAKAVRDAGLSGTLSDRARLALDHMAWTARDQATLDSAAAEYWEGSYHLGQYLLGLASEDACYKAADRALRELRRAGLIEPIQTKGGRRVVRWRILVGHLWAPRKAVDNSPPGGLF